MSAINEQYGGLRRGFLIDQVQVDSERSSQGLQIDQPEFSVASIQKLQTSGDGNCLIHAIYGTIADDFGDIIFPSAEEFRTLLSEQMLLFGERNPTIIFKTFRDGDNTVVLDETITANHLAIRTRQNKEYLGLEHADLIARLNGLNILVYNEVSKEMVKLFYGKDSNTRPDHIISFNGTNHWSKCNANKLPGFYRQHQFTSLPSVKPSPFADTKAPRQRETRESSETTTLPIEQEAALSIDPFKGNVSNESLFYYLFYTSSSGNWSQVLACCKHYASTQRLDSLIDTSGRTVYDLLVYSGNLRAIETIDEKSKSDINLKHYLSCGSQHGETLVASIRSGNQRLFEYLLKNVVADQKDLCAAIKSNQHQMFKALIHDMRNEDICKLFQGEDGKNHNIFTYCIKFESIEIFDLLIEERRLYQDSLLHMALNHRVDGVGNLLHATIEFDSQEMLQHLLENHRGLITPLMTQVNFEFSFDDEYSGLIPPQLAAARKNEFAFTHILKTFPELVNSPNIHGFNRTVSHTAAYFKFDWGIQRLYQNANFDSRDAGGSTVKDLLKDSALYRSLIAAEQQIDQIGPSLSFLPPENLVFSGGGPRGLAYVGALAALENVNDTNLINGVKRVCGTSAGAITAALLACGFNSEKLSAFSEKTPLNSLLDFDDRLPTRHREFLESEEFNAILRDNTPEKIPEKLAKVEGMHQFKKGVAVAGRAAIDAVGHIQEIVDPETREEKLRELSLKFMRFIHGIYSGEFVERVVDKTQEILTAINNCAIRGFCKGENLRIAIEQAIREETGIEHCTFGELAGLIKKSPNRFKHLYLYGTNIDTGKPELFSSEEERCKDIIISDAVRISMSIPVVFQPHGVFYKRERARIQSGEKIYVDGGLLRNFPIRDFDDKRYLYSGISTKSGPHSDTHIFNRRTMGFKFTEETNPQHGPNNRPTLSSSLSGIAALYYSAEQHLCENQVDPRIISINPGKAGLLSFHMDKKEQTILINQGKQDTEKHIRDSQAMGYSSSKLERPRTPRARQRSTKLQSPLSLRLSPFQESSLLSKINTFVSVLILTNRNRSSTSALHTQLPIVFNPGGMQDMSQENTLVVSAIQNLGFLNPLKVETSIKDFLNRNFSVDDLVSLKLIADRVKMLFSACSDLLENAESQEDQGELVVRTVINFESWTVLRSIMAAFESRVLTLEKDVAQLENRELRAKDKRKDRVIEEDKLKRKELHLENKELHQKVERLEKTRESSSTTRKELHPSKIEEMCLKTRTDAEKRIYELSSIRCDLDKLFVGLFSPGKIKKPTSFVCALHGEPETVLFKPQTPHEKKFYIKLTTLQDSAKIRNILDDLLKLKLTETSGYEDYESYIAKQAWDLINAEFNSKNNRREFPDIFVPNGLLAFKKSNIILSEMKYMLKTSTHVALNEELIQHEVKLAVPLEWDGHIGRNWWAVEDRNFPKTCYEKMVEIVSIVLARQWIQEKNEWLQNSLNYFENPSAYSKRYFAPNKQPVSKDILLGADRLLQMIKEDDAVKYFGAYTIKEVFSHLELIAFGNEEKIFKTLPKRQYGKSLDKDQLLSFFIDCFKREKHHDRDHIRRAIDKDVESILTNPPNQVMSLFKRTFEQEDGYRKGDFWRLNSFVHVLLRDFPETVANRVISNLDKYGVSFEKDEQKEKIPELIRACVQVELCHFMISALK